MPIGLEKIIMSESDRVDQLMFLKIVDISVETNYVGHLQNKDKMLGKNVHLY